MAVSVACPQCLKQYRVDDAFVGRTVRCKSCGAAFVAADAESLDAPLLDAPALSSPPRPSPAAGSRRKFVVGIIAGGVALGVLVCGGGSWMVASALKKAARRARARQMVQDPQWRERVLGEKQGWQTYADANPLYGFSAEFPNRPVKQSQGFTAAGPQWIVMAHRPQQTFSVVTINAVRELDPTAVLAGAEVIAAGMNARVTSQRPVTQGERPGLEFDYESLPGEKSFSGRIRVFATTRALHQVGWMPSPRAPVDDDVARFLDSFRLAGAEASPGE